MSDSSDNSWVYVLIVSLWIFASMCLGVYVYFKRDDTNEKSCGVTHSHPQPQHVPQPFHSQPNIIVIQTPQGQPMPVAAPVEKKGTLQLSYTNEKGQEINI